MSPATPAPQPDVSARQQGAHYRSMSKDSQSKPHRGHDRTMSAEGEAYLAEQTLVDGEQDNRVGKHSKGDSTSSFVLPPALDNLTQPNTRHNNSPGTEHAHSRQGSRLDGTQSIPTANQIVPTWDPLHNDPHAAFQDKTITVEEDEKVEEDIVDSKGKLLIPDQDDVEGKPMGSRRTSHLRLDLKPPSPQPWDQIEPPLNNNMKAVAGYYSPAASQQKFHSMQNTG